MKHILIVDDSKLNLLMATNELSDSYRISTATSGMEAIAFLKENPVDLILLDMIMPGMDGRETMRCIREQETLSKIPIIFLTSDSSYETEAQCLADGAEDFIVKPFVPMVMKSRISHVLELNALQNHLETRLEEKSREVEMVTIDSIMAVTHAIEAKDPYFGGHSDRVADCAVAIAKRLGWNDDQLKNLYYIALMHDVGKIGIPESVLSKAEKLEKEEYELVKKHAQAGGEILKNIRVVPGIREGVLHHHERYDGKGYPDGLAGEEIPMQARIIAVADAYDAMTSERAYRGKFSKKGVIAELQAQSGGQFDPKVVEIFVEMLEEDYAPRDEQHEVLVGGEINHIIRRTMNEYIAGLHMDSHKDALTGLQNRKGVETKINEYIKAGNSGALFMIDIDNFKVINDSFGHIAGDTLLREMAKNLRDNTSEQDIICRIGGDEFVVFYTGISDKEYLAGKAKGIIKDVGNMLEKFGYSVASISVGIALAPEDGSDFEELFAKADRSLYEIKRNGKNSYGFYQESIHTETKRSMQTDIENVRFILEGRMNKEKGGYNVEYNEFKQLYAYIYRMVVRSRKHIQILLFRFEDSQGNVITDNIQLGIAMKCLESAMIHSLRSVDVGTKYSNSQYILMLMDTDTENGKNAAGRIVEQFYVLCPEKEVTVTYDIQELEL